MESTKCPFFIGVDLGTSAVKGVLAASDGTIAASESFLTNLVMPQDGWVEFDACEYHASIRQLLRRLVAHVPTDSQVAGLSFAAASGNTLLLDKNDKPLGPCLSWMDRRAAAAVPPPLAGLDLSVVHEVVGWPYCGSFPLAHLGWLKARSPDLLRKAVRVGDSAVHTVFRLTGRWVVDPSTATPFYLQRQVDGQWHDPYCEVLGINRDVLPDIMPAGAIVGPLTPEAVAETGLDADTKVVLGSFDHPAAARGVGVREQGDCLFSCGTSWVVFLPTSDRASAIRNKLLVDPFLRPHGLWGAMSSLPMIGRVVDACAAHVAPAAVGKAERYAAFTEAASKADPGAGECFVNLLTDDFEAIRAKAQGDHRRMARAVMESAAFLLRRQLEELAVAGMPRPEEAALAGGPADNPIWRRILADVLAMPLRTGAARVAGAIGAARLAGEALFPSAGSAGWEHGITKIEPDAKSARRYDCLYKQWLTAIN